MAPDAPTPDPSPAEVLADTLGEFAANEDWTYEATPEGDAAALLEALTREGFRVIRPNPGRCTNRRSCTAISRRPRLVALAQAPHWMPMAGIFIFRPGTRLPPTSA